MDLRSIKPGIAAGSQMPLFMFHPQSGDMVTPMGWTKRGAPIWPVMGGAPDDDGKGKESEDDDSEDEEEDDDSEEDDDDSKDDDSDDDSDDDDKDKKGKKANPKAKIKALEEEKDRHFRKARKATKRADALAAELAEMKAKYEPEDEDDDGEDDKTKGKKKPKIDDSKIKAAEARAERLAVENAFLRVNEVNWHKPEQALALMMADDDYEIEFDEDGKVDRKSLRVELKRFAKANPHLVKKAEPKDDDDDGDDGGNGQRSTASKMNGKRKGKKGGDLTREQLAKTFPALGRIS
jgi:hypothetical protein